MLKGLRLNFPLRRGANGHTERVLKTAVVTRRGLYKVILWSQASALSKS